jgi:hypothetical protein
MRGKVDDDLGRFGRIALLSVVVVDNPGAGTPARRRLILDLGGRGVQAAAVEKVGAERARLDGSHLDSEWCQSAPIASDRPSTANLVAQ